jgi:hypothetical protein
MTLPEGMTQGEIIIKEICSMIGNGMNKKGDVFKKINQVHGYPLPTIRKFAREHRINLQKQLTILESKKKK